jgi:hypothetical protein
MTRPEYRIALLVDSLDAPKWVSDLADWAKDHPAIELAALIVQSQPDDAFERLLRLERKFLSRKKAYRPYATLYSIADAAAVRIDISASLGTAALLGIAELELDAIVRCGRAAPGDAMFGASRDGIISVDAGSAAGFVEVLEGRPDTPFTIERRRHADAGGEVLFSGSISTALLYGWNAIALQARAFTYLQAALERLTSGTAQPLEQRVADTRTPRVADLMSYGMRTARRSVGKGYRRYSGREFNFQVAFARGGWPDCALERGTPIPNPTGAFLADPFAITVDGTDYLFVEEFPFDTRKGVISAYRLDGAEPERIGVILEEPYHLSFPFVFEHDGDVYMVPESGADRSVRLYKATSFPTGWTEVKVLLADVPAVDTVLFKHCELWWMFTTIQGEGPGLNNAELHAFYAKDPLGDWTPHSLNPIVMDAMKGRNGGFVRDTNGNPCRVAQVPGFTFYGAASAVYSIDELSPTSYRESLIKEVRPTFFTNLDGTHHIHSANGLTVYDFMRVERPATVARPQRKMKANDDDVRLAG